MSRQHDRQHGMLLLKHISPVQADLGQACYGCHCQCCKMSRRSSSFGICCAKETRDVPQMQHEEKPKSVFDFFYEQLYSDKHQTSITRTQSRPIGCSCSATIKPLLLGNIDTSTTLPRPSSWNSRNEKQKLSSALRSSSDTQGSRTKIDDSDFKFETSFLNVNVSKIGETKHEENILSSFGTSLGCFEIYLYDSTSSDSSSGLWRRRRKPNKQYRSKRKVKLGSISSYKSEKRATLGRRDSTRPGLSPLRRCSTVPDVQLARKSCGLSAYSDSNEERDSMKTVLSVVGRKRIPRSRSRSSHKSSTTSQSSNDSRSSYSSHQSSYSHSTSQTQSRSRSRSSRSKSHHQSQDRRRVRSPSIRRRSGSPCYLDKRRITSARKRPVPYTRPVPSSSSDTDSSSTLWSRSSSSSTSCVHSVPRSTSPDHNYKQQKHIQRNYQQQQQHQKVLAYISKSDSNKDSSNCSVYHS